MNITVILAIVAAVAVGCVVAWYFQTQQHRNHLKQRFGPEYERTRRSAGDIRRTEAMLDAREKRVEKFHIRPLAAEEAARFTEVWRHVQTLFVDDPKGATREADQLVNDVMSARGYPMADFDQRAADISVDHASVVEHYRAARDIAGRNERNSATTEDLRQALIHYRALFEDLLRQHVAAQQPVSVRR